MNNELRKLAKSGMPFKVHTSSGKVYEIIHQDYISISPREDGFVIIWNKEGDFFLLNSNQIESAEFSHAS